MANTVIINKKQLPIQAKEELQQLKNQIKLLQQRIDYINFINNNNNSVNMLFKKWYEVALHDVVIDKEELKNGLSLWGDDDYFVGYGYEEGSNRRIYFKKADIVKILKESVIN